MKAKILILFSIISIQCSAQNWQPVGEETGFGSNRVKELYEFNNKLFVGGSFFTINNLFTPGAACWNDANWIPFRPLDGLNSISVFSSYQGELYGIGYYFIATDSMYITYLSLIKYDEEESIWYSIPNSDIKRTGGEGSFVSGIITDAVEYENELYVIGEFDEIGGQPIKNIAKWNGSVWSPLLENRLPPFLCGKLTKMIVYKDELFVCGEIEGTNGAIYNNIARWNNQNWDNLDGGLLEDVNDDFQIYDLAVFHGALYVGGEGAKINSNDEGYILHRWNGDSWSGVTGLEHDLSDYFSARVTALKTFGEFLVIAKGFGGQTLLYNENGIRTIEEELSTSVFFIETPAIKSFEILNNQLYAGGSLAEGVIRLNSLSKRDSSEVAVVCKIFPNPSSGTFMLSYHLENKSGVVLRRRRKY